MSEQFTKEQREAAFRHIRANNISITSIARKCGCSRQHVYQILNGKQQAKEKKSKLVAIELGLLPPDEGDAPKE